MQIVVICPTYNERANMEKMIPLLEEEVLPRIKNHTMQILIPDDNSPDGTAEVIKEYMKKYDNLFLLEGEKQGLGAAYVKAMRYAMEKMKADAVIEFDADFQHDPNDIPRLVKALDEGADYVIGSRYIPGGEIPKEWGIHRKIISIFGSLFARIVLLTFSIHDMTSGFKLTKTSFLKNVDLENLYSKYYAYKIHILYEIVKQKAKVTEVPIIFYERKEGSSKIEKKDLFDSFFVVLRLRWRDSKRFIKFLIVGGTGFIVQLLMQEGSIRLGVTIAIALFLQNIGLHFGNNIDEFSHGIGAAIGAESAIISNFMWNNFWTFQDTKKLKERGNFFLRLIKFNLASFASIFIQFTAVFIGEILIGNYIQISSLLLPTRILILIPTIVLLVIPINYLIYNKIIWKTQYLKNEKSKKV